MPAKHRTVGKITYIHEPPVPDLSALDDPALQVQPRPIPVIAIGDPVRVERHYGLSDLPLPEPDEHDIWAPDPDQSARHPARIGWQAIGLCVAITLIVIAGWVAAVILAIDLALPVFSSFVANAISAVVK